MSSFWNRPSNHSAAETQPPQEPTAEDSAEQIYDYDEYEYYDDSGTTDNDDTTANDDYSAVHSYHTNQSLGTWESSVNTGDNSTLGGDETSHTEDDDDDDDSYYYNPRTRSFYPRKSAKGSTDPAQEAKKRSIQKSARQARKGQEQPPSSIFASPKTSKKSISAPQSFQSPVNDKPSANNVLQLARTRPLDPVFKSSEGMFPSIPLDVLPHAQTPKKSNINVFVPTRSINNAIDESLMLPATASSSLRNLSEQQNQDGERSKEDNGNGDDDDNSNNGDDNEVPNQDSYEAFLEQLAKQSAQNDEDVKALQEDFVYLSPPPDDTDNDTDGYGSDNDAVDNVEKITNDNGAPHNDDDHGENNDEPETPEATSHLSTTYTNADHQRLVQGVEADPYPNGPESSESNSSGQGMDEISKNDNSIEPDNNDVDSDNIKQEIVQDQGHNKQDDPSSHEEGMNDEVSVSSLVEDDFFMEDEADGYTDNNINIVPQLNSSTGDTNNHDNYLLGEGNIETESKEPMDLTGEGEDMQKEDVSKDAEVAAEDIDNPSSEQPAKASRFAFVVDEKHVPSELKKLEERTFRRRFQYQKRIHELDCRLAAFTAAFHDAKMDLDLTSSDLLDRACCRPLEAAMERIQIDFESSTKRSAVVSLSRRVNRLDSQMTQYIHVDLQKTKNEELGSLQDNLFYEIKPAFRIENAKASKREGGIVRRYESIAGLMTKNYHQEYAERRAAIEVLRQKCQIPLDDRQKQLDGILEEVKTLRAQLLREKAERRAADKRIKEDIAETIASVKRALLAATGSN